MFSLGSLKLFSSYMVLIYIGTLFQKIVQWNWINIKFQMWEHESLLFYWHSFLTNERFHSGGKNCFSNLLQTKSSISVIVQKIQFMTCLKGTHLFLLRKKCGPHSIICNVWQWLNQKCIWIMHIRMRVGHMLIENLLIKRGHKFI